MYPFTEGSYAVRNGWYVAAFAHEAKRELLSRWILNEPVVIYRTEAGEAVALAGRCPHRHFPLGKSCLKGDSITCGYHGITFDASGKCTNIPSQKGVPNVYRVKKYPLVERGMWLWIWPGDPEKADPALLPDLDALGYNNPEYLFRPFYFNEIAARYQLLNDNLLDLTHIAYLHRSKIGTEENASAGEERSQSERVIKSIRHMKNVELFELGKKDLNFHDPVDRTAGMEFHLPGFHAGVDDTYASQGHPTRAGEELIVGRVFHAVTPARLNSTNYFFAMGGKVTETTLDFLYEELKSVIEEDVFAAVEIETMLNTLGYSPTELMLKSDTTAVMGRRALQAMMDRERSPSPASGTHG